MDDRRAEHDPVADGQVFIQPTTMGRKNDQQKRTTFYRHRADRARRTLNGIDTQTGKAEQAVAGETAVKRNRFVKVTDAKKSVNRDLKSRPAPLLGSRATSPTCPTRPPNS